MADALLYGGMLLFVGWIFWEEVIWPVVSPDLPECELAYGETREEVEEYRWGPK